MERFNLNDYQLSNDERIRKAQQKFLDGESLTVAEMLSLGVDKVEAIFCGYECKPDFAYRGVDEKAIDAYLQQGEIVCDEDYNPESGNAGVDWYLGGVGKKYANKGGYVIECPAYKKYFVSTQISRAMDPRVKHLKSGSSPAVPINFCKIMKVSDMEKGIYQDIRGKEPDLNEDFENEL